MDSFLITHLLDQSLSLNNEMVERIKDQQKEIAILRVVLNNLIAKLPYEQRKEIKELTTIKS